MAQGYTGPMGDGISTDRRRSERRSMSFPVHLACGPGAPCPPGQLVDIGAHGLLVQLSAPGRPPGVGERVLLSLRLADGMLHVLGRANRSVRGDDGRWYVAVEFDQVERLDRSRLDRLLTLAIAQPADAR